MLPEVSVEILGPVSGLKGHEWPRGYDWVRDKPNQPRSQIVRDEPHELVVHLPSGRTLRHISKATFFKQERGTVVRASLLPHPGLLHYQDAIKLLEAILEQWDAELDERTKKSVEQWKAEGDLRPSEFMMRLGGAVLRGEDKAGIAFEIRPSFSMAGWYLSIDVAAKWEQVRQILGLPELPASQPATKPVDAPR
jgi:hypothetical protein